jgi:hypothetical protein
VRFAFVKAQTVSEAQCETHALFTYCLAPHNQTVQYVAHAPKDMVAILFAEEASLEGVKQTDFAGQLAEGSRVLFRNGIVMLLPKNAVGLFANYAQYLSSSTPGASSQPLTVCSRMEVGDRCSFGHLEFQTWSVAVRVTVFPVKQALGYALLFRPRNTRIDPESYTLPLEPFLGDCGCDDSELPGIWILLKQQALARFR